MVLSSVDEDDSAVLMSDEDSIDDRCDCCGATEFVANLPNFTELGNDKALGEDVNAATSLHERLPRRKSVATIVIFIIAIVFVAVAVIFTLQILRV